MMIIKTPPTTPPAIAPICESFLSKLFAAAWAVGDVSADDPVAVVRPSGLEADEVVEDDTPVEVVSDDVAGDESPERYAAASLGFEDKKPAVRSPTGQPLPQASDLQHPKKGGSVTAHLYHLLPLGHCWSGYREL